MRHAANDAAERYATNDAPRCSNTTCDIMQQAPEHCRTLPSVTLAGTVAQTTLAQHAALHGGAQWMWSGILKIT
jgi:hypothetical protein